jgi:hypothetical protein
MTDWRYERDGLQIFASLVGTRAMISWRGLSDSPNPAAFLDPVTTELTERLKGADVTVDFTRLEYMNSATVGPLLKLIKRLDANGTAILVLFSTIDWQRTHLKCMTTIARTLKHVKVEGRTTP